MTLIKKEFSINMPGGKKELMVVLQDESQQHSPVEPTTGNLDLSDQGLTFEFIRRKPLLKYVTDDRSWMGYRKGLWLQKETPTDEIAELLRAIEPTGILDQRQAAAVHRRLYSKQATAAVTFFAEARPELGITANEFDPDSMLLGLPDEEVLDLRTGERRKATPHDLLTRALPVAPEGCCERWLQYLEETHPGDPEVIAYLQRLVGYWLTSDTREDMIAFFIGVGGSGKGTFAEPLQKLLGSYCVPIPIGMLLEDTQEDRRLNYIATLRGARLAICNEGSKQRRLDSRGMKALSGGGKTVGRRLGHQPIQFQQTHKLLVLANDPPVLELDDAMMQRVHVIPFNQTFRDTNREQKGLRDFFAQPEQLRGIFQWALEGCLAWQKEGLKPPASVTSTTKTYFADADLFEQFLNERTRERDGIDAFMSTEAGFQCWSAWCIRQGYNDRATIGNTKTFADVLRKKKPHLKYDRTRIQSVQLRGFAGIELLVEEYDRNRGEQYDATR